MNCELKAGRAGKKGTRTGNYSSKHSAEFFSTPSQIFTVKEVKQPLDADFIYTKVNSQCQNCNPNGQGRKPQIKYLNSKCMQIQLQEEKRKKKSQAIFPSTEEYLLLHIFHTCKHGNWH